MLRIQKNQLLMIILMSTGMVDMTILDAQSLENITLQINITT